MHTHNMACRDFLEEPPAYDSLFDTTAQLPNYASIIQSSRTGDPSSCQPCTLPEATREPRRGSATSTGSNASSYSTSTSSSSSSTSSQCTEDTATRTAALTKKKKNNKPTAGATESTGEGFFSKWRADLAEDRARRARRVVYVSAPEADRITGLDQRPQRERQVRYRVYWER